MYPDREIHYIDNPYSTEEIEKIKEWIDLHPNDIRGLVLGWWFAGNLSFAEIANMEREDDHNDIFRKRKRARFIINALKLHPENKDYVFMAVNEGRLEKLIPQSFQMKLYHVCNRLGLEYKRINRNEAIVCKS